MYLHVYTLFGPPTLPSSSPTFWAEPIPSSSSLTLLERKHKRKQEKQWFYEFEIKAAIQRDS
jgi:hypothetical protein